MRRMADLDAIVDDIRRCRLCVEAPKKTPLPHEPRPVLQISKTARICIFGQAPGLRVHQSGKPFDDPSGVRLRQWMGVDEATFYDRSKIAIVPMGFCFPGYDQTGSDLPPRPECAPRWRKQLMAAMPPLKVALLVGGYSQKWHLGDRARATLGETVAAWRDFAPAVFPLPHPSWRNNTWLKTRPWFQSDLLPALQAAIAGALKGSGAR